MMMERKMISKFFQLFATFYAGVQLIGFGLAHRLSSATENKVLIASGICLIFVAMSYCIFKCVITYFALTRKQHGA